MLLTPEREEWGFLDAVENLWSLKPQEQSTSFWFQLLFMYVILLQSLEHFRAVGGTTPIL